MEARVFLMRLKNFREYSGLLDRLLSRQFVLFYLWLTVFDICIQPRFRFLQANYIRLAQSYHILTFPSFGYLHFEHSRDSVPLGVSEGVCYNILICVLSILLYCFPALYHTVVSREKWKVCITKVLSGASVMDT